MNKSSVLPLIKQLTGFVGAVGLGALISLPAQAQLNTLPNSLDQVTEQPTSTKSETGSPESALQAQDLPEASSVAEEIPASDAGSAADLMQPTSEPEALDTPESESISQAELQQFANAVIEVQAIERQTQENMAQLLVEEGFSPERFNEIFLAQQSAGAEPAPEITQEEQAAFDQVLSELEAIDQTSQTNKEQAVMAQGLEMERFSQILTAVRQDPGLQQQVQELLPSAE